MPVRGRCQTAGSGVAGRCYALEGSCESGVEVAVRVKPVVGVQASLPLIEPSRRGAKNRTEGTDEGASAVVATFVGRGGHRASLGELDESVVQPELGSPVTKRGSGIGSEEPDEGSFAGTAVLAPLAESSAIGRVISECFLYHGES